MSTSRRLPRPSLALVIALLALVVALGGTSYAAVSLAKDSVLSKHIKNGQVKTADLKADAVTGAKVKDGSLTVGDFSGVQLPAGPAGAAGAAGPAGPKGDTGAPGIPGPVNTVTVVTSSGAISPGSFGGATAQCPAGKQAIGGGPDLENVLTMVMTASFPLINNTNAFTLPNGQYGPATAWRAFARNNGAAAATFKVVVVCAG